MFQKIRVMSESYYFLNLYRITVKLCWYEWALIVLHIYVKYFIEVAFFYNMLYFYVMQHLYGNFLNIFIKIFVYVTLLYVLN